MSKEPKVSYKGRKAKGATLERMVAQALKDAGLDKYARRSFMSGGFQQGDGDVVTRLPIHLECKNQESWSPLDAYDQALRDRSSARKTAVVVLKKNRTVPFVFLTLEDFINLLAYALYANWPDGNIGK